MLQYYFIFHHNIFCYRNKENKLNKSIKGRIVTAMIVIEYIPARFQQPVEHDPNINGSYYSGIFHLIENLSFTIHCIRVLFMSFVFVSCCASEQCSKDLGWRGKIIDIENKNIK